jgi:hypothetical protein
MPAGERAEDDTGLRLWRGEKWLVPCDRSRGDQFETWLEDKHNAYTSRELEAMRTSWEASRQRHTAELRRIGWLDQKGRIWLACPPPADFDGGSLTPLLIDARDD